MTAGTSGPRSLRWAPVLVLLVWAAASCGPPRPERSGDPDLDADVRVSPTPAVLLGSRVTIAAEDAGAPLVDGVVRLRVERHDSAGPVGEDRWREAPATPTGSGSYGPVEFDFSAAGAWWVVVELRASDGRVATIRHPLAVVGATASEVGR